MCIYKSFLKIHPFIDGNGRTIKIILSKLYMYRFNSYLIWNYLEHSQIKNFLNEDKKYELDLFVKRY